MVTTSVVSDVNGTAGARSPVDGAWRRIRDPTADR